MTVQLAHHFIGFIGFYVLVFLVFMNFGLSLCGWHTQVSYVVHSFTTDRFFYKMHVKLVNLFINLNIQNLETHTHTKKKLLITLISNFLKVSLVQLKRSGSSQLFCSVHILLAFPRNKTKNITFHIFLTLLNEIYHIIKKDEFK